MCQLITSERTSVTLGRDECYLPATVARSLKGVYIYYAEHCSSIIHLLATLLKTASLIEHDVVDCICSESGRSIHDDTAA